MSGIKTIEGNFTPTKAKFALLVSRWNSFVVESLKDGAIDALRRHGVADSQITIIYAPGAFELPLAAQKLAGSKKFDAIIALGAVQYLAAIAFTGTPGGGQTQSPRIPDLPAVTFSAVSDPLGDLETKHWFFVSDAASVLRALVTGQRIVKPGQGQRS